MIQNWIITSVGYCVHTMVNQNKPKTSINSATSHKHNPTAITLLNCCWTAILIACLQSMRASVSTKSPSKTIMDNRDDYYCGILSHEGECNSSMRSNMSDSYCDTIIMDNSIDPK